MRAEGVVYYPGEYGRGRGREWPWRRVAEHLRLVDSNKQKISCSFVRHLSSSPCRILPIVTIYPQPATDLYYRASLHTVVHCSVGSWKTSLDNRIPIPRPALDDALNLRRHPTPIKVPRLGLDPLPIDIALPRAGIQRQVPPDGLEPRRGVVVRPDAVGDGRAVRGGRDGVVRRRALPLAVGLATGGFEGELDGRGG